METDADGSTWVLSESHAMLKYLATTRKVKDHWYPADLRQRAKVDQYLDWHHNFLRQGAARIVFLKLFHPMLTGQQASEEQLNIAHTVCKKSLGYMEKWLADQKYLCGNEISIADIVSAHELDQTKFISYDLSPYPKVNSWLHQVIDESPEGMEISSKMRKLAAASIAKQKATPKL